MIIKTVQDIRRFAVRNKNVPENKILDILRERFPEYRQKVDELDWKLTHSNLRREKLGNEFESPYEEALIVRNNIATNLLRICIGILSYGHLEMLEPILKYMPPITRSAYFFGAISFVLPISRSFSDAFYLRDERIELWKWYQENKDNLIWDGEQNKFIYKTIMP